MLPIPTTELSLIIFPVKIHDKLMQIFAICHETEWMDFYISFDSWRAHCPLFIVNIVLLNRVRVSVMVRVSVSFNVSIT